MAALPAARSVPQPFIPVVTVMGAMLLALACVAWLLFFIHHISQAIRVKPLITAIAPLDDGPRWFERLHSREPNLMKVVLTPGAVS